MNEKEVVIVNEFGTFLGKKSGRIQVRLRKEVKAEYPFFKVERVVITSSGVTISASLIQECMRNGIAIDFLTGSGKPFARLSSPELIGTVKTRREQILSFNDERGVNFARKIVYAKLGNQMAILKYFAKYRKEREKDVYSRIYKAVDDIKRISEEVYSDKGEGCNTVDEDRERLLSIEGRGGRVYWDVFTELVPSGAEFEGREHRGATDPVNSLLNYGYGILYAQVWGAIELAGLDPFAGFLHVDRPGKPSMVLDLIEEFRQQVVDRTVFGLINRGYQPKTENEKLAEETRKEFSRKVLDRLEGRERYEGKYHKLNTIVQLQARHLAMFFRGERDYKPFIGRW